MESLSSHFTRKIMCVEELDTHTSVMENVQYMRVCGTARLEPSVLRTSPVSEP